MGLFTAKRSASLEDLESMIVPSSNIEMKKSIEATSKQFEPLIKTSLKKRGVTNPLQYEDLYIPNKSEEPFYAPGIFHAPVDFQLDRLGLDEVPLSKYIPKKSKLNFNRVNNSR